MNTHRAEDDLPSQMRKLLPVGSRFRGYVVERLLGAGGAGAVYLVRHEVLDTRFALKVLYPAAGDDATAVKRFLREARLASRIRHPNLVAVHDCGYDESAKVYYLVMDYVSGCSLRQVLALEGRFDTVRAADVVAQVASALKAAEPYRVVHRDIKPENIMIQTDGLVKLVDLGVAKAANLGDSLSTNTANVFGTPAYISPEQAQSSADVDARADVYSLGIVFYEMLTGACPYVAKNFAQVLQLVLSDAPPPDVRDVVREIDPRIAVLVRRMTTKDRDRRLGSVDAVLDELAKMGLGRRVGVLPTVEVATDPEKGMKTILEGVSKPTPGGDYNPLADPDETIRRFAATRLRKKRLRILTWAAATALVVGVLVFLILAGVYPFFDRQNAFHTDE